MPRFNEFRRQYGLRQLTSFDDLVDPALPAGSAERVEQERLVGILRDVYGRHRCDASKPITDAQVNDDGTPINDCLGHPDGSQVDNVEDLDTVVGWLAESRRPHGFAISETQLQVFILNASRRLFSDRFFTSSFRPEFYSHLGVRWVIDNGPDGKVHGARPAERPAREVSPLKRILLRTIPALAPELAHVVNVFDPWARDRGELLRARLEASARRRGRRGLQVRRQRHAGTSDCSASARGTSSGSSSRCREPSPSGSGTACSSACRWRSGDREAPAPGRHLDLHLARGSRGLLRALRRRRARLRAAPGGRDRGDSAGRGGVAPATRPPPRRRPGRPASATAEPRALRWRRKTAPPTGTTWCCWRARWRGWPTRSRSSRPPGATSEQRLDFELALADARVRLLASVWDPQSWGSFAEFGRWIRNGEPEPPPARSPPACARTGAGDVPACGRPCPGAGGAALRDRLRDGTGGARRGARVGPGLRLDVR